MSHSSDTSGNHNSSRMGEISVTYTGPHNAPFQHRTAIPASNQQEWMASLKAASVYLQTRVNDTLTSYMEDDKAREGGVAGQGSKKLAEVDEVKEEERYGEEIGDDDS